MTWLVVFVSGLFVAPAPLPGAIPGGNTFPREDAIGRPVVWAGQPWRVTRFWKAVEITDGGFRSVILCDDPECEYCRRLVYGPTK